MRGDNLFKSTNLGLYGGTPPHAWGQPLFNLLNFLIFRYTPTCVGTTIENSLVVTIYPVHPHMRGDNVFYLPFFSIKAGTPPHAWGQLRYLIGDPKGARYTPTCVGTTSQLRINS